MDYQHQPQVPPVQPKNWLVESILATIFCCLPLGVVGIVFAVQVNNKFAEGDYAAALAASKNAGQFTKLSFWVTIAGIILSLVWIFLFGGLAIWNSMRNGTY